MKVEYKFNNGKITPVYVMVSSTNEEKFEGLMRKTMVGNVRRFSHFIACTSLLKGNNY